jgi:hypothetical protein
LLHGFIVLFFLFANGLHAESEIHLSFAALERMVAKQLFSGDGRRYVRGDRNAKCNYAWLEKPRVEGEDGRLVIRARFTGRTAWDVFGRCIGLGESFDVKIATVPYFKDGSFGLSQTRAVPESGGGLYVRQVCGSLSSTLNRDFRYPLAADVKRAVEDTATLPEYPRDLRRFDVTRIAITDSAVVLTIDFALAIH